MRKIAITLSAIALVLACGLAGIGFYIGLNVPSEPTLPPSPTVTTVPTQTITVPTTAPTIPATVQTNPTTVPTEPPTVPTEPPTVPTEPPTVPTEPPTVPTEPPTVPTEPPTVPTEPPTVPTEPTPPVIPDISARHAFVYDLSAGKMLFSHGKMDESFSPASITKLFTVWVGLQYLPLDTVITVGEEVNWIDPGSSRAQLKPGYKITAEMCVQAMIIRSGNDAAYSWAVAAGRVIAGDVNLDRAKAMEVFMAEMNRQAQELGLTGTHFVNPDGITADDQYMNLTDLLQIAKLAMETPIILETSGISKLKVTCLTGQKLEWQNSNYLLHKEMPEFYCPEAFGLKTGSTKAAGKCLISAFHDGDRTLLICVMGCPDDNSRFGDSKALFETFRNT